MAIHKSGKLPETPEEFQKLRDAILGKKAGSLKTPTNEKLGRDHPLIRLFLSSRSVPDQWQFWTEQGFIWTQKRIGKQFLGNIIILHSDGSQIIRAENYERATNLVHNPLLRNK